MGSTLLCGDPRWDDPDDPMDPRRSCRWCTDGVEGGEMPCSSMEVDMMKYVRDMLYDTNAHTHARHKYSEAR